MNRIKLFPKNATLDDKIQLIILAILRLSLIGAFIWAGILTQPVAMFMSVLALILTFLPVFINRSYNIRLPVEFEFVIVLFVYASIFLGEVGDYYQRFWWWDGVLHIGSGLMLGFVGFLILYVLHYQQKLKASPFILSVFSFSFGLAVGALWEIFEFAMDQWFGSSMQKSGLKDTMGDLVVDAGGTLLVAVLGYRYLRDKSYNPLHKFIYNFLLINPHLKKPLTKRLNRRKS